MCVTCRNANATSFSWVLEIIGRGATIRPMATSELGQTSQEVSKLHAIFVCLTAKRNGVTKAKVISMLREVLSEEAKRRLHILVSHCPAAAEEVIRPQILHQLEGFGYDIEDRIYCYNMTNESDFLDDAYIQEAYVKRQEKIRNEVFEIIGKCTKPIHLKDI
jgi:hypothetical protein